MEGLIFGILRYFEKFNTKLYNYHNKRIKNPKLLDTTSWLFTSMVEEVNWGRRQASFEKFETRTVPLKGNIISKLTYLNHTLSVLIKLIKYFF